MVQNDGSERLDIYHGDFAQQIDELETNALRVATRLVEAIPENEVSLSTCQVYVVARTAQGRQITYTHDCLIRRQHTMDEETRAKLRAWVSNQVGLDT